MRRPADCATGIVASVGRSFCRVDTIREGIEAGALTFRLALGLRDRDHLTDFAAVREAAASANTEVDVLLDLPADRLRVGAMEDKTFRVEDTVLFVDAPETDEGDAYAVPLPGLADRVDAARPGHRIVFRDGRQAFRVTTASAGRLEAECILCTEPLTASNGCAFPDSDIRFDPLHPEDGTILAGVAEQGLCPDWVAASLVASADDVRAVQALLEHIWPERHVRVMAKIETCEAVDHAEAILSEADGCLIGRGDLGLAMPAERLPGIQRELAAAAARAGKPFAVATQILEQFAATGAVYRAELSDIALAVRQRAGAVVLCQETSDSRRPVECIELARRIIAAESEGRAS